MRATRIKMKPGCGYSNNLTEIAEISHWLLTGWVLHKSGDT
jgi:hypothetical protein